jgi:hypothetical protein
MSWLRQLKKFWKNALKATCTQERNIQEITHSLQSHIYFYQLLYLKTVKNERPTITNGKQHCTFDLNMFDKSLISNRSKLLQTWTEHTTPEGRKYWYNNASKSSTWEKPEDLLTEVEKALKECEWQEFTSPDGKKYYSHKTTKESKWEMPEEYKGELANRCFTSSYSQQYILPCFWLQRALKEVNKPNWQNSSK